MRHGGTSVTIQCPYDMTAYRSAAAPPPKAVDAPALAGGRWLAAGLVAVGLAVLAYGHVDDVALDCTRVDGGEMRCAVRAGLDPMPPFRVRPIGDMLTVAGVQVVVLHDSDEGIDASDVRHRIEGPTGLRDDLSACVRSSAPRCVIGTIPPAGHVAAWIVFALSLLLAAAASVRYRARVVGDRVSRSLRLQILVGRRVLVDRAIDEVPLLVATRRVRGPFSLVLVRDEALEEEQIVALTTHARAADYAQRIYDVARWSRALPPDLRAVPPADPSSAHPA